MSTGCVHTANGGAVFHHTRSLAPNAASVAATGFALYVPRAVAGAAFFSLDRAAVQCFDLPTRSVAIGASNSAVAVSAAKASFRAECAFFFSQMAGVTFTDGSGAVARCTCPTNFAIAFPTYFPIYFAVAITYGTPF